MTLVIAGILLLGFLLIATENVTNVNKAAVAIFACTVGWVLYIGYGTDFVMSQHADEYVNFLNGRESSSVLVKEFIADNIFMKYVGRACEVVLFFLATMTIVDILENNGCFDFISQWLRTRNSQKMLWVLGVVTLIISANLDNLTTTVMMLVAMRKLVPNRRLRMIYGSTIVLAANCGGALTVIGSATGLMLWSSGLITPTGFSLSMAVPCLLAWAIPTWWIGRELPDHFETEIVTMPYRGDDTRLNIWQRFMMLVVGIGGLWFIPIFHNITKLSPFIGALCVLSLLWVVNEVFNCKLLNMDSMTDRRVPKALFYGNHQIILYVIGIILALGVVRETGVMDSIWAFLQTHSIGDRMLGMGAGMMSIVLENFSTAASFIILHPSAPVNDEYWMLVAYMSATGGNILTIGSIAGVALMRTERMHIGWYFMHVGWKAAVGALVGLAALLLVV
ncbi:SLC13 family permease [Hallella bergensis]|uniref:SLC13 family permease n=1 Tax=Hallella bergensis TaxID=242750 RepID=UPI003990667A